ncbi:MAG: DNA polymerase III subunit alpha, partial [Oscillospiraceae bacterium]
EMSSFASYAFNKSHAAAYAFVSYQTAWLKCHYPKHYMAALLTSILDNTTKVVAYIGECERLGIKILPPDVRESNEEFTATEEGIRFGLLAIKNLGRGFVRRLIERREQRQFESFSDFCERMYDADFRRRTLESLIKSGSLDCFGSTRRALLAGYDPLLIDIDRTQKANLSGQINLFDGADGSTSVSRFELPLLPEFEPGQLLKMEKEVLGLYVSGHPLHAYRAMISTLPVVSVADILAAAEQRTGLLHDDAEVKIAAVISAKKLVVTKRGDTMAYLNAEDLTGSLEVLVFPRVLEQFRALTEVDSIVCLSGRLSYREEEQPKLRLEAVISLNEMGSASQAAEVQAEERPQPGSKRPGLYLKVADEKDPRWEKSQKYLAVFDGPTPVYVYFAQSKQLRLAPKSMWVSVCEVLLRTLRAELGEDHVVLKL